jgi:hypothetical protein
MVVINSGLYVFDGGGYVSMVPRSFTCIRITSPSIASVTGPRRAMFYRIYEQLFINVNVFNYLI